MTFGFLATCVPCLAVVGWFDFWSQRVRRRCLRRFCAEIEQSSIPAAIGDSNARLWCVNAAFLRTWGLSNENEVSGRWLFELFEDTERCMEIYQCLQSGRTWRGFLWTRRPDAPVSLELYAKVAPCPKTGLVRWTFLARGDSPGWLAEGR